MIAEKGPIMAKAATRLLEISEDEHTRHRLESYRRFEMDNRVMLKEAKAEGRTEVAVSMKNEGMPFDVIARLTKLSVQEIEKL